LENLKIGLVGRADHDNFGDSLMFAFYIYYLTKENKNVFIIEPSDIFMNRFHEMGLACDAIKLKDCTMLDKVIFVGGGYFGQPDLNTKQWLINFEKEAYFYKIAKTLKSQNVNYYIHGVEVGPLDSPVCRTMVKEILTDAKGVIVRNVASKDFVQKELGLNATFLRDVVLEVTNDFSKKLNFNHPSNVEKHLVIHGTGKFFKNNPASKLFSSHLVRLIKNMSFKKVSILFDQSTYPNLVSSANLFKIQLNTKLGVDINVIEYNGMPLVLNTIINSTHIVTTKLHLGVVGLSYGKSVFCISNMEKNKRFYNELFDGNGRIGLFKALLFPKSLSSPKFVLGTAISEKERISSQENISKLNDFLQGGQ
jgi:polysaccharide pyruvyl transferase WcaK-like protein